MAKGRGVSKGITLLELGDEGTTQRGDGSCLIAWDCEGTHLICSNSHSSILFHSWPPPSPLVPLRRLTHHRSAITTLALSPSGRSLASGSLDHSVKLYSYPEGEFQSNVTRFTLPIRSLAFSPTGSMLAAAGEDDGIKLISTIDSSIVRVFKGHNAPVVSLTFDPNNDYLASAGSDGTIMCWSLSTGKRVHTLYHAAPNIDLNKSCTNQIAWHPKGDVLAVPGRKNGVDVVMYDRDTGEKVFSLKGGHAAAVGFLAWSPNGKYLATAAGDNQVILWDVDNRQDIDCQKFEAQIYSLAWKPKGNALAVIDADGKFGVWEPVVPAHMTLPSDDSTLISAVNREALLHFSDDDDDGEQSVSEGEPISRDTKLNSFSGMAQNSLKQSDVEHGSLQSMKKREPQPVTRSASPFIGTASLPEIQKPFQPGSTERDLGKRHFLTYNLIGSVTSCLNEGLSHIEVEFHDTGKGVRVPAMTDYFGFTMAAMNETGSVFASPRKGEKDPSTILYKPFSSWASNSEWSMRLPCEEEVEAVAIGSSWVAASTSLHHLRLFSEGGLQTFILSLEGPVVTMAGHREFLAVATHAALPFVCGKQVIHYALYNIVQHTKVTEGRLPLSPGSRLTWLGFSESGSLSFYDSKGLLRVLSSQYGGSWIPVFSASKEIKDENNSIWLVGLSNTQVMCVVCKFPDRQPQVSPKPILSIFNLSLPLAHSDLGAEDLESEFLLGSWRLAQLTENPASGEDEDDKEEEILALEASLDRCILRLIAAACKADKLVKAVELTKKLTLDKSWKGAIKLVNAMRLPALAERLSSMYEEKMIQEAAQDERLLLHSTDKSRPVHEAVPDMELRSQGPRLSKEITDAGPLVGRVANSASIAAADTVANCPTVSLLNGLSSSNKLSKAISGLEATDTWPDNKESRTGTTTGAPSEQNGKHAGERGHSEDARVEGGPLQRSSNPFAKSVSNPFAKSPASSEAPSSLLDSFKRTREPEVNAAQGKEAKSAKSIKHS